MTATLNHDQLFWRCRRGMLELDWLLRGYVEQALENADAAEYTRFVDLLDYPDPTLLEVLMGRQTPDDPEVARLAEKIRLAAAPD